MTGHIPPQPATPDGCPRQQQPATASQRVNGNDPTLTAADHAAIERVFGTWPARGFVGDLIPLIPPDATISPYSRLTLDKLGKTPGQPVRENGRLMWSGLVDWTMLTVTPGLLATWAAEIGGDPCRIGLRAGMVHGIDVDGYRLRAPDDDALSAGQRAKIAAEADAFGETVFAALKPLTLAAGAGLRFRTKSRYLIPFIAASKRRKYRMIFKGPSGRHHVIELLGVGQQYVVAGEGYQWRRVVADGGTLATMALRDLPVLPDADLDGALAAAQDKLQAAGFAPVTVKGVARAAKQGIAMPVPGSLHAPSIEDVRQALAAIPNPPGSDPQAVDRDAWVKIAHCVVGASDKSGEGWELFAAWSMQWAPGDAGHAANTERLWASIDSGGVQQGWPLLAAIATERSGGTYVGGAKAAFDAVPAVDESVAGSDGMMATAAKTNSAAGGGKQTHRRRKSGTASDLLLSIVDDAALFHTANKEGFADCTSNGHRETWAVESPGFRRWLHHQFYLRTKATPDAKAMRAALDVIDGRARYDGPERTVFLRIAQDADDKAVYVDLGGDDWRAVRITGDGWEIVESTAVPVRFRRAANMDALPPPERGGDIHLLRPFLNLRERPAGETENGAENYADSGICGDDAFTLVVAWLLKGFRLKGTHPILGLSGDQGSGKTATAGKLRGLIDPNRAPWRGLPRDERDLFVAAQNSYALLFDNVSGVSEVLSDALCRLASGGASGSRKLYTDDEEKVVEARRLILLTGIEDVATRADLVGRFLFVPLAEIAPTQRKTEEESDREFAAARPRILGAMYDLASAGLHRLPETRPAALPRMADLYRWSMAWEPAAFAAGTVDHAFTVNEETGSEIALEADFIAVAVRTLLGTENEGGVITTAGQPWEGSASALLEVLRMAAGTRNTRNWPASPQALTGRLKRARLTLRRHGVVVEAKRRGGVQRARYLRISRVPAEDVTVRIVEDNPLD